MNLPHPTYEEAEDKKSGWVLLPKNMSVFHDNGEGKPELKYVNNDGREAVFDGDTLKPMTNPKYKGTYNYVTPVDKPSNNLDIKGWAEYGYKGIGHVCMDVIPYVLTGNKNERDQ